MSCEFLVQQIPRMNRARHLDPWMPTVGSVEATRPATAVHRSDRQHQHRAVRLNKQIRVANTNVKSTSQPEQSKSNMISRIKRDALAAELLDEDEQGGKFTQVEGFTTVDAEEIPCESLVEDDFLIEESAEGVDEEIVKAIVGGKKKELDVMWKHSESLTCAKNYRRTRRSRDGKTFRKATSGDAGS